MPALLIPQAFTLCTYLKNKVIAKVTEDLLCSIYVSLKSNLEKIVISSFED